MKGFYGKLLRVNLTEKKYSEETIPEEILHKYLGGKGLGSYLLIKNVKPGTFPLSPENKLIFTIGPATGAGVFGSSRYGVFSKSPLTGLYAESYSGGKVAPIFHKTGYDAVILEGVAASPVYIEISDKKVEFHDAGHLWGKDTYVTEDTVLEEISVPGAQAVVIGPAGENLVSFACIENNYWRSAGRAGLGAVMGSKKVKAIVFHGDRQCEIADPELLKSLTRSLKEVAKTHPAVKTNQTYGTTAMVRIMNGAKAFPTRYWSEGSFEKWEDISGDALITNFKVKSKACPNCFLACGKLTTIKEGKYEGLTIEGPEYETLYAFGGLCCISSLEDIIYINDLCDRLGMDTITAGNLAAFTIEAVKRKKVNANLEYGDAEGVIKLLEKISNREGLGAILANGIKYAAQAWNMEDIAIHVKGMEPAGYEPRVLKGMGLAFATSTRGACHLRATFYKPELSGLIAPDAVEGKAKMFIEYENRLTIFNTQILCVFFRDFLLWPKLIQLIKATTGWEYTQEELEEVANRIVTMTRVFNSYEGSTIKEDTLPKRFFKEPVNYEKNIITEDELKFMVDEYYCLRGWDDQGLPLQLETY